MQDPFGLRRARRNELQNDMDAAAATHIESLRHAGELLKSKEDRKPAMLAWVERRRAASSAAAERKRMEETATIREAGKEAKSRPRSNSAYGGRRKSVRRHRRRFGKKSVKRRRHY